MDPGKEIRFQSTILVKVGTFAKSRLHPMSWRWGMVFCPLGLSTAHCSAGIAEDQDPLKNYAILTLPRDCSDQISCFQKNYSTASRNL